MYSLSENDDECSEVVERASVMMNPSVGEAHQGLEEWRSLFLGEKEHKQAFGSWRLHSNEEIVMPVRE